MLVIVINLHINKTLNIRQKKKVNVPSHRKKARKKSNQNKVDKKKR